MHRILYVLLLMAFLLLPLLGSASSNLNIFTWVVLNNRAFNIAYGGNCSDVNFYFNEVDANFDPDFDGNAAKVLPNAMLSRTNPDTNVTDYNFVGTTNPADRNIAYGLEEISKPPVTNNTPSTQLTTPLYANLGAIDGTTSIVSSSPSVGGYVGMRTVFKVNTHPQRVVDLNFTFVGQSIFPEGAGCLDASGVDKDFNIYIWNYTSGAYQQIASHAGTGNGGAVNYRVDAIASTAISNFNIANYISYDKNITFIVIGSDGGEGPYSCLFADYANLRLRRRSDSTTFCQSSTVTPMTIRNTGNTTFNLDGNFSSAFTGVDSNIVLKVWMGDPFCGNSGFGGWEATCSVTNTSLPVTTTTCKNFNRFNATTSTRLISSIAVDANNQLCYSGDLNGFVPSGEHAKGFNTVSG